MNHTPPIFINHGKNTVGYFSTAKPKNLIIFVHGFVGDAVGTWNEFPSLVRSNSAYSDSDVIFFGYDSLKGQANNNALRFYQFLKLIAEGSANHFGYKRDGVTNYFTYNRILIVAHSLGSIIVRRALLNAKHDNKDWLSSCKMVLFAPAHRGARIQNLVTETSMIVRIFAGLGFYKIPVLDDLRPQSQTIQNLIADTQKYLTQNDGDFTIAHNVIWADKETVVHNDSFCNDPVATLIDGKSHTTVCKPTDPDFLEPFTIVTNAIQ